MKKLKGRIEGIWRLLTSRNFILLHSLEEIDMDGEPGSRVAVIRRTDFSDKRDLYMMATGINASFNGLSLNITDEVDASFDENGTYKNR